MDQRNAYNVYPVFTIPYCIQKSLTLCIPITSIQLHLLHDARSVEKISYTRHSGTKRRYV